MVTQNNVEVILFGRLHDMNSTCLRLWKIKRILIRNEKKDVSNRTAIWGLRRASKLPVWPEYRAELLDMSLKNKALAS